MSEETLIAESELHRHQTWFSVAYLGATFGELSTSKLIPLRCPNNRKHKVGRLIVSVKELLRCFQQGFHGFE